MKSLADVPQSLRFALFAAIGILAFLTWDQLHWWTTKTDYNFGFLVPLFVAYVMYERLPAIRKALAGPMPPPSAPGRVLAWMAVACGGLLFLFGALIRANQAQPPASFALAVSAGVIILALIYLQTPVNPGADAAPVAGAGSVFSPRLQFTAMFLFPAFVWVLSAPLLGVVETQITVFLLNKVSWVVYSSFSFLGIPILRDGAVLTLGDGNSVLVEDACSGIRSLTGCIFVGTFLAAVFLNRLWKKVLLVTLAALLAVVTNIGRGVFLTAWAYANGSGSIAGTVHDVTGYAVLGVTFVLLWCLLPLFNLKIRFGPPPATPQQASA